MTKWFGLIAACFTFALMFGAAEARAAETPSAVSRGLPEYHLGPGDKVRVITFGEDSLSGDFLVSASGKISLPLVGELTASGLTARDFQTSVEAALKDGYLKEPKVSVEILNYRPFYILGEVEKPGTYPYTSDLNVLNAVATAGGFTYRANKKRVFIKHQGGEKEETLVLGPATQVLPGDTIRIEERLF